MRRHDLETVIFGLLEDVLPEDVASLEAVVKRYNHWASEQLKQYEETERQRVEAIEIVEQKI